MAEISRSKGTNRDRHGRGIRQPLLSNLLRNGGRHSSFEQIVSGTCEYLKNAWPEELIDLSAQQDDRGRPAHHRAGFDDVVWFRMDIGRRHNADPRWVLPLLCRRGHITKNEIGAIRIAANETFFQVPRSVERKFRDAVHRTAIPGSEDEHGIIIELSPETPRDAAKGKRRAPDAGQARRYQPKPTSGKPHRKGPRRK